MNALESIIRYVRLQLEEELKSNDDKTKAISCSGLFLPWEPGVYSVGDIRTDEGKPYECISAHDSITNPTWTIKERTLWKPSAPMYSPRRRIGRKRGEKAGAFQHRGGRRDLHFLRLCADVRGMRRGAYLPSGRGRAQMPLLQREI